ncbi:hypothetical protein SKAU_G00329580 [Synaphobranchus kaupii]|uniref:SLP adapter and CSK-interacting membrane protein n=1 Tax=Synaphobranchus kaupii TaxID=118154 RepID=A0A9Q1EQC7_SYNKA|nr:hypothetical protein SKAU_G00329580 [Synaphobranchus kaupii]
MELLREFFWLFVMLGMVIVSIVFGILFFVINKCINRRAEQFKINSQQTSNHEFYKDSRYHPEQLEEELPPLPARHPYVPSCPSSVSYEDVTNLPDYVKVDEKAAPPPYQSTTTPVQNELCPDRNSVSTEAYDDVVLPGYESDQDYDDVG